MNKTALGKKCGQIGHTHTRVMNSLWKLVQIVVRRMQTISSNKNWHSTHTRVRTRSLSPIHTTIESPVLNVCAANTIAALFCKN